MEQPIAERMTAFLGRVALYIKALAKWLAVAAVIGAACGVIGSAFHIGVHEATTLR